MRVVVSVDVNNGFLRVLNGLEAAINGVVRETIKRIEANVKMGMQEIHSGAMYGTHQASAPGEYPAIDTGALINSVQSEMETDLVGVVYTNSNYAMYLEYGTINMSPRSFMVPSTERERDGFMRRMADLEGAIG